ncbi:MAG: peptidyl-prolyl cis-trans isomerase [Verrucomicrobia bacterium]|nr:peptidyl-prolyl cis-trans isomerase [Verrucomicrobiota bacterium]
MKLSRFVLLFFVLSAAAARAELVDGIVAIVNTAVITSWQVRNFAAPAVNALGSEYQSDSPEFQQKLNAVLTNSLELLVERQLILHYFDTAGYQLPPTAVDEMVNARIRSEYGDRVTLMKTLQAQGETLEQFRRNVRDQYIETALRRQKVLQQIVVSPFQIEQYYQAHRADFHAGDQVKLRMIVLNKAAPDDTNALARAQFILAKIRAGASFAAMAAEYSQGSQKAAGGEWGWVERTVLRKELAHAAFALKAGQVSDVIETPDACYIMLVEGRRPAHVRPLGHVRSEIEATLRSQEQARLEKQWIDSLKRTTFVRFF